MANIEASYSRYARSILNLPENQQTYKNALDAAIEAGFPKPAEAANAVMDAIDTDRKRLKERQPANTTPLDMPLANTIADLSGGKLDYRQAAPLPAPLGMKVICL